MAEVEVIDLRAQPRPSSKDAKPSDSAPAEPHVPLSEMLIAALKHNLADGGQSLVFMNRRGYHNFLQCQLCGNVIACPNCSVSMTFHMRDRSMRCHYCGEPFGKFSN